MKMIYTFIIFLLKFQKTKADYDEINISLVWTNDEELKVIVLLIKKGLAIEEEFEQMPILF